MTATLLFVEDDDVQVQFYTDFFSGDGYKIEVVHHGADALRDMRAGYRPDGAVIDALLPDMDGVALLQQLRRNGWDGRAVLITALPTSELERYCARHGYDLGQNDRVFFKPYNIDDLDAVVRWASKG